MPSPRFGVPSLGTTLRALGMRPRRWRAALKVSRDHVPSRWWRRSPRLPFPDRGWLAFRNETAFGSDRATADADDLAAYLDWSFAMDFLRRDVPAATRRAR